MNTRDRIANWERDKDGNRRLVILDIEFDKNDVDELLEKLNITNINRRIYNIYKMTIENANDFYKDMNILTDVNYIKHNKIESDDIIMKANKAIFNYCSSIGMYIDVIEKNLSKLSNSKLEEFEKICNDLYDDELEYRFFVILRNYIMHYDMPFNTHKIDLETSRVICNKEHLLRFKKWKRVKDDLNNMGEEIDIPGMVKKMNKNLAIIFIEFQALISYEIIDAYKTAVEFTKKYNVSQPCVVRDYHPEKHLKEGDLTLTLINLKDLVELLNELKKNPLVQIREKKLIPVE